jgi:multidrug efflux pump subunit AcrB
MDRLGNEFLPQLDDGQINVRIALPPGTTPEETDLASRRVENELRRMPYVESVFAISGGHLHGGVVSERPGTARMDVVPGGCGLRPELPAGLWVAEAQRRLRALDIPNARIWVRPPRIPGLTFGASGTDMDVMIVGEDLPVLRGPRGRWSSGSRAYPRTGRPGSCARGSHAVAQRGGRSRAGRGAGLNVGEVGRALRDAVTGTVPTRYATGANEYDVRVRLPRAVTGDEEALGPGDHRPRAAA